MTHEQVCNLKLKGIDVAVFDRAGRLLAHAGP